MSSSGETRVAGVPRVRTWSCWPTDVLDLRFVRLRVGAFRDDLVAGAQAANLRREPLVGDEALPVAALEEDPPSQVGIGRFQVPGVNRRPTLVRLGRGPEDGQVALLLRDLVRGSAFSP